MAFPDNTSQLLIFLSAGTFSLCIASLYFVRLLPSAAEYSAVPTSERRESNPLKRNLSEERQNRVRRLPEEAGTPPNPIQDPTDLKDPDETSSLISGSIPGDLPDEINTKKSANDPHSPHPDVRGLILLRKIEFYQLFFMLGLFTGLGLMTIK